jgi:hypothetical protein
VSRGGVCAFIAAEKTTFGVRRLCRGPSANSGLQGSARARGPLLFSPCKATRLAAGLDFESA